jgi:two-component system, LytTR family, sensor kinase
MIKDQHLRLFFIPLLGILIPFVSDTINYSFYTIFQLISAHLYFIFISFCIWAGCNWIHVKIRPQFRVNSNVFIKVATISLLSALYAACIGGALTLLWFRISKEVFTREKMFLFVAFTSMAVILFTLVYEILFLTKERQIDTKVVDELDRERMQAEMSLLKNEMDPHFIFNSLTTLNHLILNNPSQAHLYNNKLAQVYKYFLINKNKEMISLHDELEFIESYFFLLQLRHENKLEMEAQLNGIS